jgi:DNA-binding Lrp family transcriptional regulator
LRYGLVLVKVGAAAPLEILEGIKGVDGVLDAYVVFGRFDIVVFIEAEDYHELKDIAGKIAGIEGIKSTETLVHGD